MSWLLVALAFAEEPASFEPRALGEFAPRPWMHGPDGPGDSIPEEGYEYDEEGNGLGWIALGLGAGAAGTAIGMRQARLEMENATCQEELDEAYVRNKRRGYTTYGLLGGATLFLGMAVAF